ncbi:hypothetical protein PPL_02592 [Heterostelium album PN500]|uniref:Uncharacterized protein n=1 Tax=Heterostelium pallidum (strain ATCC 26659 / Pp 5 / PN500) TaxID=670386 RepID=D3B2H9_HETP5|nr:hypothetical protein PPL_02592 [Heterostelium album PN500]EFA83527.1 hypothetical protein PPL_02592 [Heterostelium album PN500]|eukprot:XP_020435644.1 hypothetical protein PPL_02592 [Heterostelium album PN500]
MSFPFPSFCAGCGKSKRPNEPHQCDLPPRTTDTFCVHCRSWISVPTARRCPNCNSVLHGGIVVSNPNEPDYSVVHYHRGNTNRNPYGGNPFGGNPNGGFGGNPYSGNPYGGGGGFIDIILVYEWRQVVTFQN